MEPRIGSCRRRNHDIAHGTYIKDATGRRTETQTWHYRMEGNLGRYESGYKECQREHCVSSEQCYSGFLFVNFCLLCIDILA